MAKISCFCIFSSIIFGVASILMILAFSSYGNREIGNCIVRDYAIANITNSGGMATSTTHHLFISVNFYSKKGNYTNRVAIISPSGDDNASYSSYKDAEKAIDKYNIHVGQEIDNCIAGKKTYSYDPKHFQKFQQPILLFAKYSKLMQNFLGCFISSIILYSLCLCATTYNLCKDFCRYKCSDYISL